MVLASGSWASRWINRSGTGSTVIDQISFSNSGTVNVLEGTLDLRSGFSNFSGGTLTGGTYNVAGIFKFAGADIVTNAATIVLDGAAAQIVNQSSANALTNFAANAAARQEVVGGFGGA